MDVTTKGEVISRMVEIFFGYALGARSFLGTRINIGFLDGIVVRTQVHVLLLTARRDGGVSRVNIRVAACAPRVCEKVGIPTALPTSEVVVALATFVRQRCRALDRKYSQDLYTLTFRQRIEFKNGPLETIATQVTAEHQEERRYVHLFIKLPHARVQLPATYPLPLCTHSAYPPIAIPSGIVIEGCDVNTIACNTFHPQSLSYCRVPLCGIWPGRLHWHGRVLALQFAADI